MIISQTPFRISFFGGGTDYPVWYEKNGGAVISATSVREVLKFLDVGDGVEIQIHNDVPARSGLGASSAFTVGLLHALKGLKGKMASKEQLALNAIHIEQNVLKENVGSQDQIAAAFGGFNKIEFGGARKISVKPITLTSNKLKLLEDNMMMFFTGMARNASEVAAEQIKNIPHKESELKTMHSYVEEAEGLLAKENFISDFGKLLHENWLLKKGLSSKITNSEIDEIYNIGKSAGAYGGKLLGAGGGGFILFLIAPEKQKMLREKLGKLVHVPVQFENSGSRIIHYSPPEQSSFA